MDILKLNELDRVEILTLEDNYIDMVSLDDSAIVSRVPLMRGGKRIKPVLAEHGFAAIVRTSSGDKTRTMVFDFGLSEEVAARNADALGANLSEAEAVALSHGHMDHHGGFNGVADGIGNKGIEFVTHPVIFRQNRFATTRTEEKIPLPSLGKTDVLKHGFRIVETRKSYLMLGGDVLFLGEIPRRSSFEKGMPNTYYEEAGKTIKDDIEDDSSIVMNLKGKGLIVVSGCAHAGIVNTVWYAREVTGINKVHVVMGGFHLTGSAFEPIIDPTVALLKEVNPDYVVPTHCTGRKAIATLESAFPGKFILNMSGTKLMFKA